MTSLALRGVCVLGAVAAAASAQTPKLSLVPIGPTTINPGQTVTLEIFVDDVVSPDLLRTYQTTLEIIKATGAVGSLALADPVTTVPDNTSLYVHPPGGPERTDWVFYGAGTSLWSGNVQNLMLGGVLFFGAVEVPNPKYCGTYILKAAEGTSGDFYVRFRLMDGENPATFLRDANVNPIAFTVDPPGGVTVKVQAAPLTPPNDACVDSQTVTDGTTQFTTVEATTDGPAMPSWCNEGAGLSFENDVWYDYAAGCTGILMVSTCGAATFNTRLAVYSDGTATCPCPTDDSNLLACDDDGPGCSLGTSEVAMSVIQGECYTIRLGGLGTAEGTGSLTVICIPDECGSAKPVAVGSSTPGTTKNATPNDAIGPTCGPSVVSAGVWYSVTGTGNLLTASLLNGSYDTRLTVYSGTCAALTCVGGADNVGSSSESVSWCSTAGTQYLVLVHGAPGASGTFTLRVQDDNCNDSSVCTTDACVGNACVHTPNYDTVTYCCTPSTGQLRAIDDGNPCTNDVCNTGTGVVTHPAVPNGPNTACSDSLRCTLDQCISGACAHTDINTIPCTSDANCPIGTTCGTSVPGRCFCDPGSPLEIVADPGSLPVEGCYANGETFYVYVVLGAGDKEIIGAQFFLEYDPSTMVLEDLDPGHSVDPASPFRFVLNENINPILGTIDYGVSANIGAHGTFGPATVAAMIFRTISECSGFVRFRDFGPNGAPNRLVTYSGIEAFPILIDLPPLYINDTAPVETPCPADIDVGTDAGMYTARVSWSTPTASDSCDGNRPVTCTPASGTVFSAGTTNVVCAAANSCGVPVSCSFDVTVQSSLLTTSVQLSPSAASGPFTRCITFDLWDCGGPPGADHSTVSQVLTFTNGVTSNVQFSIPGGAWECITARDKLHTLRSTAASMATTDGINYTAGFVGDWSSSGHWLVGGNLNDDQFVDILDFGILSPRYLSLASASTNCGTAGPHANINGDDRVDLLDLVFITGNWLSAREPNCCGTGGAAASSRPLAAISVEELRRRGLDDMVAADLNRDGIVDLDDIVMLMAGSSDDQDPGRSLDDGSGRKAIRSGRHIPGR